jgi:hypothetical protein
MQATKSVRKYKLLDIAFYSDQSYAVGVPMLGWNAQAPASAKRQCPESAACHIGQASS